MKFWSDIWFLHTIGLFEFFGGKVLLSRGVKICKDGCNFEQVWKSTIAGKIWTYSNPLILATSILATLANWRFVLCHFPSILGISYIVIPRKLAIFKYWSYIMDVTSFLAMFCLAQNIAKNRRLLYYFGVSRNFLETWNQYIFDI